VTLSEADVLNTFEVMAGLEAQSGELAAERITDAELAEIRAMHFEMLAAWTRRDLSNYYRLNASIHQAINAAAKNPVLTSTYSQVNARLQALRFRSNQDEAKWKAAVQEHEQMVDALAARDAAGMRTVLLTHLNHKRDVVMEQIRTAATDPKA
jgi:DNA-binding GntR family transcriptional regulator